MNKHSKHAAAFNTILVFGVIFVILIAVLLTYISNTENHVRYFIAALIMFSPTVVICYALYCHFDNQDTIITNQEKLIEKMDAINNAASVQYTNVPQKSEQQKADNTKTNNNVSKEKPEYKGWTCPKCGASNSMTDISCPECGAYR